MAEQIHLARPDVDENDIEQVVRVLRSPELSLGPVGARFERAIADYAGARHGVAVNSGTSGLHLAVIAAGLEPGDEVITTPFSFVASTNCILFARAKPVFVDIDPDTWDIDPDAVEAAVTARTKAILPVHVFGRPCRIEELSRLARERGLFHLEDSCESLGSSVHGKMTGTFGDAGIFAFYPNKQLTTGEGGVLVTGDDRIADLARSLRNQGRDSSGRWLEHVRMGYNYRLSDIQAALGLSQLGRIEAFIATRQRVFDLYRDALSDVDGVIPPAPARPGERISWFVFVVRLGDEFGREDRDAILEQLRARGIGCRNYFTPIHLQPFIVDRLKTKVGQFPVTEGVAARTIALPFHNRLTEAEVAKVVQALREAIAGLGRSKT